MGPFHPKWKMYELKIYRVVTCHGNEEWCKILKGSDLLFQNWHEEFDEFWHLILARALESLRNLDFNWLLLNKVYNVWAKKLQRSCVSWNWRVMQNLKKNWLAVRKMTWGIWQIFTRALESLKIGTSMGSFYPK